MRASQVDGWRHTSPGARGPGPRPRPRRGDRGWWDGHRGHGPCTNAAGDLGSAYLVFVGEFSVWLLGNALVMGGTPTETTALVDVGGVPLVIALALVTLRARRGTSPSPLRTVYVTLRRLLP